MKNIKSLFCVASLSLALVAGVPATSHAAPLSPFQAVAPEATSDVIHVQRNNREGRRMNRHQPPRHGQRHGHRRNDNLVPLIGGLAAGAIILGIEADRARERERRREREIYYDDDDHIAWCLDRYRSYDIRSDSYQPFEGPRRRCISPYS